MKRFQESETVELKVKYIEEIRKEIIAFANTNGGTLYIGVDDDGNTVGLDNPDFVMQQVTNGLRDAVKPDISMFISYEILEEASKQILEIKVQRGVSRPYYLAAKGLRPAGVYVRQGSSSVPASEEVIRAMIKYTDGELFENMRSLNQDLTFEYAAKTFSERNIDFGYLQMCSLKMIVDDTVYTNLALLLSDQCPHIIKAARFSGENQENFQDRCEFTGSLLKQLDDAYAYLMKYNKLAASFEGLLRIDKQDYPSVALRESLLNAIVHRDYSLLAPTLLSIYDDRVEIASFGSLVADVDFEDLLRGMSVCRNPQLANIFYRLRLIEAYGTGLQRITRAYTKFYEEAEFIVGKSSFRVILPNLNYAQEKQDNETELAEKTIEKIGHESLVLKACGEKGYVTRAEVEDELQVSSATAARILSKLVKDSVIIAEGNGRNRRYVPKKSQ